MSLLVGPIVRRVSSTQACIWLCSQTDAVAVSATDAKVHLHTLKIGEHCHAHLATLDFANALIPGQRVDYDIVINEQTIAQHSPYLLLHGESTPYFYYRPKLLKVLHGSCRKPHHDSIDGLVQAESLLHEDWPDLLVMTGDQVYIDDVSPDMLHRIHELITHLGIADEHLPSETVPLASKLHDEQHLNKRPDLLPDTHAQAQFFGGKKKPIFTSAYADNHLISFAEVVAMYLLTWSPATWQLVGEPETDVIKRFAEGMPKVARLLAHIPTAMIFDDHDITDDWNLTAGWERAAYNHPLSKRIIGNALLGYFIFQGWGNQPESFDQALLTKCQTGLQQLGEHDSLIDDLLAFDQWHYSLDTQPKLVVLDTRTHRWRSERNENKPSGLMDWESLTNFQQSILGEPAVIVVSPSPIFGVKLIEAIQKLFTLFGQPLMVDAENWMAHPGSANTLMNIFYHPKTPQTFTILSGDVHYSFAYDIELRQREDGPDIWQITSSGIKNEFPAGLLAFFDRANRWLYAPYSPLNLFTKRRHMRVTPRRPVPASKGRRLANQAGIGLVKFNQHGQPTELVDIGEEVIRFELEQHAGRWE
ncbi:alkaline phosphatase D family protein [Salinibius halmophilus]|uniref:alkaline phosphatase D family protein n=1 Tax=Salinibius halmophilus TaxID=1853216 RepID=UPI000E66A3E5|nr:alkaline phosphatase D family protein [Salinibius halmophilus]